MNKSMVKTIAVLLTLLLAGQLQAATQIYKVSLADITLDNAGPRIPSFESTCNGTTCIDWWNGLGWGAIDPPPGENPLDLMDSPDYQLMNLDGVLVLVNKGAFSIVDGVLEIPSISNGFFVYDGTSNTRFVLNVVAEFNAENVILGQVLSNLLADIEPCDTGSCGGGGGTPSDDWLDEWYLDDILGRNSHWSTEYADVYVDGMLLSLPKHTIHAMVHSGSGDLVR